MLESLIEATYTKERLHHLRKANLGIEKLRFLFRLAADLRLLTGAGTSMQRARLTRRDA